MGKVKQKKKGFPQVVLIGLEELEALKKIAQAMVDKEAIGGNPLYESESWTYCIFCGRTNANKRHVISHTGECICLLARKVLKKLEEQEKEEEQ